MLILSATNFQENNKTAETESLKSKRKPISFVFCSGEKMAEFLLEMIISMMFVMSHCHLDHFIKES